MNDTSGSAIECADRVMKQEGLLKVVSRVSPAGLLEGDSRVSPAGLLEGDSRVSPAGLLEGDSRVSPSGLLKVVSRVSPSGLLKVVSRVSPSGLLEGDSRVSPSGLLEGDSRVSPSGLLKVVSRVSPAGIEERDFPKSNTVKMEYLPFISNFMMGEYVEPSRNEKTNLSAMNKKDVEEGKNSVVCSGEVQSHENEVLSFAKTPAIIPAVPRKDQVIQAIQPMVPVIRAENQNEVKEKRLSAMKIACKLAQFYTLGTFEGSVYIFETNHYKLCDNLKLEEIIYSTFKQTFVSAPGYNFLQDVRKFLILEALAKKFTADDAERVRKYLGFKNGYLKLDTLQFFAPNPNVFITSYLDVDFVPLQFADSTQDLKQIHCPNFDRFITSLADDDPVLVDRIYEMIGYILSNDCAAKKLFVMGGVKDSGKSRLGRFIISLFSEGACCSISIGRLGDRFALGKLPGKALCVDLDLPSTKINARTAGFIKSMTGSDPITAENKYENPITFINRAKLLYATNHTIEISEDEYVLHDRIVYIPVRRAVPQNQQLPNLLEYFETEKLLIVMKAIGFYRKLVKNKYKFSGNFSLNSAFMHNSSGIKMPMEDLVHCFVEEKVSFVPWDQWEFTDDLFTAFCDYCRIQQNDQEYKNFSRIFFRICGTRVNKDKKRRDKDASPLSGYWGVQLNENI